MQRLTISNATLLGVLSALLFTPIVRAQSAGLALTPAASFAPLLPGAASPPATQNNAPGFPAGLWELSHENDWFIYSDRDYTGGLRLAYTTPNYATWSQVPIAPAWLGSFFDRFNGLNGVDSVVAAALYAQLNIYTPNDSQNSIPDPTDHPYSGWVGLGMDVIRQSAERRAIFEVNLGLIGPDSGGQDLQDSFHDEIGDSEPAGWNDQLKNEPVLQLTYRQDWRPAWLTNLSDASPGSYNYDVIGHGLVTVGNGWDYAAAGLVARWGYHLPMDFGPARLRLGDVDTEPYQPANSGRGLPFGWSLDDLSAYVCLGAETRAVARDITLDGNTWANSPSVVHKPIVSEIYTGLVTEYGHFRGSFLVLYETTTFYSQPQPGQWRGILTLGVAY
jgi:lipid A 3-O-deacylase